MENLHQIKQAKFMIRSNPIGLAEPSIKRDGYAVGKDGSYYRSSENIFSSQHQVSNLAKKKYEKKNSSINFEADGKIDTSLLRKCFTSAKSQFPACM